MNIISDYIVEQLKKHDIRQADIAREINVSREFINQLKRATSKTRVAAFSYCALKMINMKRDEYKKQIDDLDSIEDYILRASLE